MALDCDMRFLSTAAIHAASRMLGCIHFGYVNIMLAEALATPCSLHILCLEFFWDPPSFLCSFFFMQPVLKFDYNNKHGVDSVAPKFTGGQQAQANTLISS